jgi:Skp family chaperone for outer membrane proteins
MNSKLGKQEQEAFENLKNQRAVLIEEASKQLEDIVKKLSDPVILDSMNPETKQKLENDYARLSQDLKGMYEECQQVLYQKEIQIGQKLQSNIDEVVREMKYDCPVFRSEALLNYSEASDETAAVVKKLDERFDQIAQTLKKTPNETKHEVVK